MQLVQNSWFNVVLCRYPGWNVILDGNVTNSVMSTINNPPIEKNDVNLCSVERETYLASRRFLD